MFGFKWYKPKEAIRRSIMDQTLYDLGRLNTEKFRSVYSSDMALIKWGVLYPDIITYGDHLNKAISALTYKQELYPYDYAKDTLSIYVSEFSLGPKKEYIDTDYHYKVFRSQLIELLKLYQKHQKDDDSVLEYNVRILSKLIENIFRLTAELSKYPE